jgi:hypothetical protein
MTGNQMIFFELKQRENYAKWKVLLETYLELEGYWEAVLGTETADGCGEAEKGKSQNHVDHICTSIFSNTRT